MKVISLYCLLRANCKSVATTALQVLVDRFADEPMVAWNRVTFCLEKDLDDCLSVTEMLDFYLSGKLAEPTT